MIMFSHQDKIPFKKHLSHDSNHMGLICVLMPFHMWSVKSPYRSMQYIDREGKEDFYGLSAYPDTLYKKVTLLKCSRSYMSEHLLKVKSL